MAAKNLLILALVGCLAQSASADISEIFGYEPAKVEPGKAQKLIDVDDLTQKLKTANEALADPDDVGKLGTPTARTLKIPGMERVTERLEFDAKTSSTSLVDKLPIIGKPEEPKSEEQNEFDFEAWKKATGGDKASPLQVVSSRSPDLQQLVDYNRRYRKYGDDANEDKMDFDVVREGFGKAAAMSFEGVLLLANSLEAQDTDKDGKLTKAEFVTALRAAPADAKEERVRKAAKLDKDPEALFELLRVDDAEQVDIGAFIEGISYALSPRQVSAVKTAQEESEELARGGLTADSALEFAAKVNKGVKGEAMKALEVKEALEQNSHIIEFDEKTEDAKFEATKQIAGLGHSVKRGDLADLSLDIGKGVGTQAARYAGAMAASGVPVQALTDIPGVGAIQDLGKDIQREYKKGQEIVNEVAEEEKETQAQKKKIDKEEKQKAQKFKVKVNDEVYELRGSSRQFYRDVDEVMKATNVDHKTAAQALAEADGNVASAVQDLEGGEENEAVSADREQRRALREQKIEDAKRTWQSLKDRVSSVMPKTK